MKQHRDKDVWRHRPDELPLVDGPSMGSRRKKGPLQKAGKKRLGDLAKQAYKDLALDVKYLASHGIPFRRLSGRGWVSADCDFAEWACDRVIKSADKLEEVIKEMERRMA